MRQYRTALVTGASSGIGRSLAVGLARSGTLVVLAARRQSLLEEVAAQIHRAGGRAVVAPLDVADTEATVARLRELDAQLEGLDLIVANAGVGVGGPTGGPTYAWEAMRGALHTNLCGAAATLTAVLPQMVARGRGHLLAISSLASFGALPGSASYCTPKAGLSMLTECLRLDTLHTGVAVTTVHVGFVKTPMVEKSTIPLPLLWSSERAAAYILQRLPLAPCVIDFPWPMVLLTKLLAALPTAVRDAIMRHQPWVNEQGPAQP